MQLYWQHVAQLSDGWVRLCSLGPAVRLHVLKENMKSYVVLDEINFTLILVLMTPGDQLWGI